MRRSNRDNTVPAPAPPDPSPPSTPPAPPAPPTTWAELFDVKLPLFLLKCKVCMYVNKHEFINGIYAVVVCELSVCNPLTRCMTFKNTLSKLFMG